MEGQKSAWEEFINGLEGLDDLPESPKWENPEIAELIDKALSAWFEKGFQVDSNLRDLMVLMYEDSLEIKIGAPLLHYLDAIFYRVVKQDTTMQSAMRMGFILGIAFGEVSAPEEEPPIEQ